MKRDEEKIKMLWPGWEVTGTIGHGSFGSVYGIQRIQFGKIEKAAIKVLAIPYDGSIIDELYSEGYDDASILKRMEGELQNIVNEYYLMAELKGHTNVVHCDDMQHVEHEEGIGWDVFIKMELLTPLSKVFGKGNRENISDETVIKLGKDICQALTLCEKKNIVHRDIKPQNIFQSDFGEYKLGDFGIAKTMEHTTSGTKTGTYKYMAPEVYSNKPYGHSADIYSLGLVLYWLLNENRMPFLPLHPAIPTSGMDVEARTKRLGGAKIPEPKNGSPALKEIILKACEFDPKDRFASAQDMLNALEGLSGVKEDVHKTSYEEEIEYEPTMGNSWEDTQGTMGNLGERAQKEPDEYEATAGKQVKGYETKTHQQKEIEPEVAETSQKKGKKEKFFRTIVFGGIILVVLFVLFHNDIEVVIKSIMNPENEYYANGNIKTEEIYDSNGNRIRVMDYDENGKRQKVTEYNAQGKIVKQAVYVSNGSLEYEEEYNSQGEIVKNTRYNSDGSMRYVIEYDSEGNIVKNTDYNSDGNEAKSTRYNSDGSIESVIEYDSDGNEVKCTIYNSDGSIKNVIEYDSDGNRVERTSDESMEYVDEYDSEGKWVKSTWYNLDGSVEYVIEYENDSKGNCVKSTWYNSDGNVEYVVEYEYDSEGNLVKGIWYNSDGSVNSITEYENDSKGNSVKGTCYNSDGSVRYVDEYERDSEGNLVKSTRYNSDGSEDVTEY